MKLSAHRVQLLVTAALALPLLAGCQSIQEGVFQIGYAANLNIGDSLVNLSNSGAQGGFAGADPLTSGNLCANVYVFDPGEEEVSCCSCLVTPNGFYSLSANSDLASNRLTSGAMNSIVIALLASQPGVDTNGAFTVCNPSAVTSTAAAVPYMAGATGSLALGLTAWGTTLEPSVGVGAHGTVRVPYKKEALSLPELTALTAVCGFIQSDGSGFGVCGHCQQGSSTGGPIGIPGVSSSQE